MKFCGPGNAVDTLPIGIPGFINRLPRTVAGYIYESLLLEIPRNFEAFSLLKFFVNPVAPAEVLTPPASKKLTGAGFASEGFFLVVDQSAKFVRKFTSAIY
jgi:hypothetical protein